MKVPIAVLPIMKNYLNNPFLTLYEDCEVVNVALLEIDERLIAVKEP